MTLSAERLEPRDCPSLLYAADGVIPRLGGPPFPGWDGPLSVAAVGDTDILDGGDRIAVGAGEGGGPRVTLYAGREKLWDVMAFESEFRGGVSVAIDAERVYVGAGPGGGPRLQVRDFDGDVTFDEFLGVDSTRTGLSLAGGYPVPVAGDVASTLVLPHAADPPAPLDVVRVAGVVRSLPAGALEELVTTDSLIRLTNRNPATVVPSQREILDQGGGIHVAYAVPPVAWMRGDVAEDIVRHEVGHLLDRGRSHSPEWLSAGGVADSEEYANAFEAWSGGRDVPTGITSYFDTQFGGVRG